MDEQNEQPEEPAQTKSREFVRAFSSTIRQPGVKRALSGRVMVIGVVVALAGTLAFGIGALAHHRGTAERAADVQRSPSPQFRTFTASSPPIPSPGRGTPKMLPMGEQSSPGTVASPKNRDRVLGSSDPHTGAVRQKSAAQGNLIVGNASNRCIDLINGQRTSGTPIQIWDCGGVAWQRWVFASDETIRTEGMCMAAVGGTASGTPIEIEPCNGGPAQRFNLNKSRDLVNIAANKCVDVKDKETGNGTHLQLWTCKGTSNQKWHTA